MGREKVGNITITNKFKNNCLVCSNSFSKEGEEFDTLICVYDEENHKEVKEDYSCSNFN